MTSVARASDISIMTLVRLVEPLSMVDSGFRVTSGKHHRLAANDGIGFGLGVAAVQDPTHTQRPGSVGEYYWEGSASTTFWIDPVADLTVIFLTQFIPSDAYNFRGEIQQILYPGLVD